jgi:hypothetical protein
MIIMDKANCPQRAIGLPMGAGKCFVQCYRRFSLSSRLDLGWANFLLNAIFPYALHALGAEK